MDAWYEHCRAQSDRMRGAEAAIAGLRAGEWMPFGGTVIYPESKHIYGYLCAITRAGFFTVSSQPTSDSENARGARRFQRAYLAGYAPPDLLRLLRAELPPDVSVCPEPESLLVAYDAPGGAGNMNWGGAMDDRIVEKLGLSRFDVRPCELVDLSWARSDHYLFAKVLAAVEKHRVSFCG